MATEEVSGCMLILAIFIFFVVGILLIFAWPFFLVVGCLIGIYYFVRARSLKRNILSAKILVDRVASQYQDGLGVLRDDPVTCFKFREIFLDSNKTLPYIGIRYESIFWDERIRNGVRVKTIDSSRNSHSIKDIKPFSSDQLSEKLLSLSIDKFIKQKGIEMLETNSLDEKVCSIIFENYPEAIWADESVAQIHKSLEPLQTTYKASQTNELLAANRASLEKSIAILQRESKDLSQYAEEAWIAIHKCYEFLAVPENLKKASNYETQSLEIYSRRREMRDGFAEVLAIKQEYDLLSGR